MANYINNKAIQKLKDIIKHYEDRNINLSLTQISSHSYLLNFDVTNISYIYEINKKEQLKILAKKTGFSPSRLRIILDRAEFAPYLSYARPRKKFFYLNDKSRKLLEGFLK